VKIVEVAESAAPRLMKRKDAARYMGMSFRKFDEIKHSYKVTVNGMIFYDRVLIDRHIDVSHAA
jgi:hypothetical protein